MTMHTHAMWAVEYTPTGGVGVEYIYVKAELAQKIPLDKNHVQRWAVSRAWIFGRGTVTLPG